MFEGRAATGYDHGYDAQVFYLGLALDPKYVEGFVEGCLERIGEEDSEGEALMRDLRGTVLRRRPCWTSSRPSAMSYPAYPKSTNGKTHRSNSLNYI